MTWTDISGYMPDGFKLRAGAGGGDPKDGLCYMETVALIAGEPISDQPKCACPIVTDFGIGLNDTLSDNLRTRLLPLAWAAAGTASPEHAAARLKILGLAACDVAEMALASFEAKHPDDVRPRKAIEAARAFWRKPSVEAAEAIEAAANAGTGAAYSAANVAAIAAAGEPVLPASIAVDAVRAARNATADKKLRLAIIDKAINALREAILAGPHGGIPEAEFTPRIDAVRELLPVTS